MTSFTPRPSEPIIPLPPEYAEFDFSGSPPDFEAMKVEPGDVITAQSMNDLIDVVQQLYDTLQKLQQRPGPSEVSSILPRVVTEVDGIGRQEAKKLAQSEILTLQDLGSAKPSVVESALGVDRQKAQQFISDAFTLTGRQTVQPLTDIAEISSSEARTLINSNIRSVQDLANSDAQTLSGTLNIDPSTADTIISAARNMSGN